MTGSGSPMSVVADAGGVVRTGTAVAIRFLTSEPSALVWPCDGD